MENFTQFHLIIIEDFLLFLVLCDSKISDDIMMGFRTDIFQCFLDLCRPNN